MTRKFYRKDTALRTKVKSNPCVACGTTQNIDSAHVRTFGASGIDAEWNLLPLCRTCHMTQHQLGWVQFTKKFPSAGKAFTEMGWIFLECNGQYKLFNEKHEGKDGNL